MSSESRIELTDRLRREGRWGEAYEFRERKRRQFRAAGLKRSEAHSAAWDALAESFPPLDPKASGSARVVGIPSTDRNRQLDRLRGMVEQIPSNRSAYEVDARRWVGVHLNSTDFTAADVPSRYALLLLISFLETK